VRGSVSLSLTLSPFPLLLLSSSLFLYSPSPRRGMAVATRRGAVSIHLPPRDRTRDLSLSLLSLFSQDFFFSPSFSPLPPGMYARGAAEAEAQRERISGVPSPRIQIAITTCCRIYLSASPFLLFFLPQRVDFLFLSFSDGRHKSSSPDEDVRELQRIKAERASLLSPPFLFFSLAIVPFFLFTFLFLRTRGRAVR